PLSKNRGLRVCRQTTAVWKNDYLERRDPRGSRYWWLMGEIPPETINAGSDKDLLSRGFITVTPLRFDFTDEDTIRVLDALQLPEN
ncbi:MAG: 5'/3'-nucleotidase SurE, partial [Desulfovibrio sp.]|nr:5'/3'-nucleotidase SurE [Desulfovibrio sp.]